jgi:hypothetical protein
VTDTARVLLTAAVLSFAAAAVFTVRIRRLEPTDPARVIGELRLAQWSAVLLAALGGAPIGLAAAEPSPALAHLDATLGIAIVVVAGVLLHREPPQALRLASAAFIGHALVQLLHRPGWLPPDLAPLWYTAGSAAYDLCMAAVCFWAPRR